MKYGTHIYLLTDRWSDDRLPLLDLARELNLDMMELSVGDDVKFTPRLTRDRAEMLGLDLLVGPGGAWPYECDISADDPVERAKGLAWHKRVVDLTAETGALAYMGSLYGHSGVVKRRRPPADEYPRTAEGLHALAEHAARAGILLALEPMSHFRSHLVNTPEQVVRLVTMADHPNLRILFDTYHAVTEVRDYAAAIRTIGPLLFAVHACENDRGVPGTGLIPWEAMFTALHAIGFNGYIGLEGYNSSIGDFALERGMFHNVCPDGPAFIKKGITFLRGLEARAHR